MVLSTTNTIEGHTISDYLGIVTGVAVNSKKASFSFKMAKYYESIEISINQVKEDAFQNLKDNATKLNANAVVGISIDVEVMPNSTFIMVSVVGTAVKVQ